MRREPHGKLTGFLEEVGFHSIWIVCFHAYEKSFFRGIGWQDSFPGIRGWA
mgnify:CR=1 FL=1